MPRAAQNSVQKRIVTKDVEDQVEELYVQRQCASPIPWLIDKICKLENQQVQRQPICLLSTYNLRLQIPSEKGKKNQGWA